MSGESQGYHFIALLQQCYLPLLWLLPLLWFQNTWVSRSDADQVTPIECAAMELFLVYIIILNLLWKMTKHSKHK